MKIIILICVALAATQRLSAQTTWFVSTTGSNANTGKTPASAFATVGQAVQVAACGDSVYVLAGTYREKINAYRVCPDNNRITIQGDVTNRPLIIGDSVATNKYAIGAGGQGFTFRHLELTSPYPDVCSQAHMVVAGSGQDMSFIDLIIRNAGYDGVKTTSDCNTKIWARNWKIIDCQVINNGLPCPASAQNGDGIDFTHCQNCQITGTSIINNRGHQLQVKLEARNVRVENCRIEGNLLIQVGLPGNTPQCDTTALNADSVYFRHNIIIAKGDTSEFVFKLANVSNLVIENNTVIKDSISKANVGFICFGGCAGGGNWKHWPLRPVVIRNNIFASLTPVRFYAGPDTTFFDPFGITAANVTADYNLFYDRNGQFTLPVDHGTASKVANPLFCRYPKSFELADNSPCVNAGDPASPNDPDNSRSDIGALYYHTPCPPVGVKQPATYLHQFLVGPAIARDYISVTLPDNLHGKEQVQICNAIGALVNQAEITQTGRIDIRTLPDGLYYVRLKNYTGLWQKFIKQ